MIFTDRVRSTRREVIVSLCLSVYTCGGGGYPTRSRWGYPSQVQSGGGTWIPPSQVRSQGVPQPRGVPPGQVRCWEVPDQVHVGGTLARSSQEGVPGYPPVRSGPGGYLSQVGYPPARSGVGGVPQQGGGVPRTAHGVLDKWRLVCLLRSRRRTFLLNSKKQKKNRLLGIECKR